MEAVIVCLAKGQFSNGAGALKSLGRKGNFFNFYFSLLQTVIFHHL